MLQAFLLLLFFFSGSQVQYHNDFQLVANESMPASGKMHFSPWILLYYFFGEGCWGVIAYFYILLFLVLLLLHVLLGAEVTNSATPSRSTTYSSSGTAPPVLMTQALLSLLVVLMEIKLRNWVWSTLLQFSYIMVVTIITEYESTILNGWKKNIILYALMYFLQSSHNTVLPSKVIGISNMTG